MFSSKSYKVFDDKISIGGYSVENLIKTESIPWTDNIVEREVIEEIGKEKYKKSKRINNKLIKNNAEKIGDNLEVSESYKIWRGL